MNESNRIEFKRELTDELDIEKEVVAFLNYREGGIIYIGVEMVESLGSGMPRIMQVYGRECFTFMEHFIRFTVPFYREAIGQTISQTIGQETEMSQSEEGGLKSGLEGGLKSGLKIEAQIMALIEENPQISMTEIAMKLQRARSGIAKHLKTMQQNNTIRRVGPDKGGHWEIISQEQ